ncbi:MAG: hypothetical protein Ct9H300mP28_30490 [Pseudomonadota bacterium]|nr:MAG: hypothetical protein Ct9H300mP28_30490 [Pseudomonadota bacterium]
MLSRLSESVILNYFSRIELNNYVIAKIYSLQEKNSTQYRVVLIIKIFLIFLTAKVLYS